MTGLDRTLWNPVLSVGFLQTSNKLCCHFIDRYTRTTGESKFIINRFSNVCYDSCCSIKIIILIRVLQTSLSLGMLFRTGTVRWDWTEKSELGPESIIASTDSSTVSQPESQQFGNCDLSVAFLYRRDISVKSR